MAYGLIKEDGICALRCVEVVELDGVSLRKRNEKIFKKLSSHVKPRSTFSFPAIAMVIMRLCLGG